MRLKAEKLGPPLLRDLRGSALKADVDGVIHIISPQEYLGPLRGWLQQIIEGGHRPVVQIGSAQPQTVQGHARIALGLPEILKALVLYGGIEHILIERQLVGVIVEA